MQRYFKPKSAPDQQTFIADSAPESVAVPVDNDNVNRKRSRSPQKQKGSQTTITEYYRNQVVPGIITDTVESQFNDSELQTTKQYYIMEGNDKPVQQSQKGHSSQCSYHVDIRATVSSSSSRLIEQQDTEEPSEKRIKLDHKVSTTADAATRNQRKFIGNTRDCLPFSTAVSSTLTPTPKPSTTLRDTSKLPSEESSSTTGPCLAKGKTSLIASGVKLDSSKPLKSDVQELTPDLKYKASLMWQKIRAENLDCDYVKVFGKREADKLFQDLNSTLTYFTGELAQIKIYGKRYEIPRKQVAHGDEGVTYTYSGVKIPAKPWTPVLNQIREKIQEITQHSFNFVLINRYEDGNHYMGEHRDDEKDLRHAAPIASVSLGCTRDFVFRHADSRGREAKRSIPPIKLQLEHGSLLVMKYPTNVYWYHALPVRRKEKLPRINLTFRDIVTTK